MVKYLRIKCHFRRGNLMRKIIFSSVCLATILSLVLIIALFVALFIGGFINLQTALFLGVLFSVITIILNYVLAIIFVPKFVKRIKADFNAPHEANTYSAITNFVDALINTKKQNETQISDLSFQIESANSFFNNMQDGFIILDRFGNISTINPKAKAFFGANGDYKGKNINTLNSHTGFSDKIKAALQDHGGQMFIETDKIYSIVFLPSKDKGVVVLISNVTGQQLAEKSRIEFPANVSRELSAPLTIITGFADLIAKGATDAVDATHFAQKIGSECRRMLNTVENIKFLSELDEMNGPQAFVRFDVARVAAEAIESWKDSAAEAGVSISLSATICPIRGNRHLIYALFSNLLSNAVRYNKLRGEVKIAVSLKNNFAYINVTDTGIGFTKEEHHMVFDRFYRTPHALSRDGEGSGLGLSIVREIVRYHDGTIDLESEPGAGTRVFVKLPQGV